MKLHNLSTDPPDLHQTQAAEVFLEEIQALLDSDNYHWASNTLEGIHATVSRTNRVSEGQRRAVTNIKEARHSSR